MLAIALLLQAAGPVLVKPPSRTCQPRDADEVVVCARPGASPYRLKPLPPRPGDPPRDPLAFKLPGDGEGRVYAFERGVGGVPSRGLAVKATFPLGRKKQDEAAKR